MSYCERHTVALTTDASGDCTAYTPVVSGKVISVKYTKTNFSDGVDFDATGDISGVEIWNQDNVNATQTIYPRAATHSTAGVAALYAAGGSAVLDHVRVANERIKIVVAAGGNVTTGSVTIILE